MSIRVLIGIDPGERWIGRCALTQLTETKLRLTTAVYDAHQYTIRDLTDLCVRSSHVVVCEQFRIRGVGHQRFNKGETLQLIGAFRYAAEVVGAHFVTVAPGSVRHDLFRTPIGSKLIKPWMHYWPTSQQWEHALSAWRVLSFYLLNVDSAFMTLIRQSEAELEVDRREGTHQDNRGNFIAPVCRVDLVGQSQSRTKSKSTASNE